MTVEIKIGDALSRLKELPPESVQCVVTSPPYWALRAYGTDPVVWGGDPSCSHRSGDSGRSAQRLRNGTGSDTAKQAFPEILHPSTGRFCPCGAWLGELGQEPTPDLFVEHLVSIFREVRRVLKSDGTLWLNIGDSMGGSGRGPTGKNGIGDQARRQGFVGSGARSYGRTGKALRGYQDGGSSSSSLCDGCRAVLSSRTARTDPLLVLGSVACAGDQSPEHMGFPSPSLDGSGSESLIPNGRSDRAKPDQQQIQVHVDGPDRGALESTSHGSLTPPLGGCSHCGNCGACLAVLRSSSRDGRQCVRRAGNTDDTSAMSLSSAVHTPGRVPSGSALVESPYVQPYSTTPKPKDLVGIPWMLAFALRADGWYLRSNIRWCKSAPMPESVKDRPTSAVEDIFLLAKSERYFYSEDGAKEPAVSKHPSGNGYGRPEQISKGGRGQADGWQPVPDRNMRNFWLLNPEPFADAHFATFPPELPRRCILAGSRKGDTILDPFGGAGTSGLVASRLDRSAVLIERNPAYAEMARKRIDADAGPLLGETVTVSTPEQLSLLDAAATATPAARRVG